MVMGGLFKALLLVAAASLIAGCDVQQPVANVSPSAGARPCSSVALKASRTSPITAGQAVTFAATASGCPSAEYRFVLADATATAGTVMQDWSRTSKWTWNTFTTPAGQYTVRVDARAVSAGDAPPNASAYLAFTVAPGSGASLPVCRLPVSGAEPGSGGFLALPGGAFTADPASNVALRGQPDTSGLRRGYTYDAEHLKWLPVPRDWVMPDLSSYVYIGTEYPHVSNQPALHRVNVASGADTLWANGDQLYGYPIALRPEGVYGAPGPEIITMIDPSGVATTIDQGHYGLFAVITGDSVWASKWTTGQGGRYELTDVERIDPQTQTATDWFRVAGATAVPIGVDATGYPIIAVGTQLSNARIAATQIWVAPHPSLGAAPQGQLLYSDTAHPLTILGSPIASGGAIWLETAQGLWVSVTNGPMTLVSPFSGYIAGGCQ